MSCEEDYKYALELHNLLNCSNQENHNDGDIEYVDSKNCFRNSRKKSRKKRSNPRSNLDPDHIYRMKNMMHPQWETLDPTPDIVTLFNHFDNTFFQSRLKAVTIEWGKAMRSCAGICYTLKNCRSKDITIRLSEPLLKLRPRKDLIETMLHEMIHVYCFILNIREGNGGHGPQFKKIMNAINKISGTNITVYHTLRDEVKFYNLHWWCCNGMCQERSPFFGYVIRTSTDAPGPEDVWWCKHIQECGGTFMKIKGPAEKLMPKKVKKSSKEKEENSNETNESVDNFPPQLTNTNGHFVNSASSAKSNNLGTMLLASTPIAKSFPPTSYPGLSSDPFNMQTNHSISTQTSSTSRMPGGNLHNVVSLKDLNARAKSPSSNSFDWGKGNSLSRASGQSSTSENRVNRQFLRNVWGKRSNGDDNDPKKYESDQSEDAVNIKQRRISSDDTPSPPLDVVCALKDSSSCEKNQKDWVVIDDDIMLRDTPGDIVTLSSGEDSDEKDENEYEICKPTIHQDMTAVERQTVIKKEIIDESIDLCEADIELIDDEFGNNLEHNEVMKASGQLADTSIIDKFFGPNTFLKEFQIENDLTSFGSTFNSSNEIITCPICQTKMSRWKYADHLNGCTGITIKIQPPKPSFKNLAFATKENTKKKRVQSFSKANEDVLRSAGYLDNDITQINLLSSIDEDDCQFESSLERSINDAIDLSYSPDDENTKHHRQRSIYKTTRQCPKCAREIEESDIRGHLKKCPRK
uniref:Protein with SprT-like domain at the N terminus n=1 Tax=Glossina brevipalpis TaxID=37001 RepID=A0A1A9X5B1_9MUSC